jgi:hypothetical protein
MRKRCLAVALIFAVLAGAILANVRDEPVSAGAGSTGEKVSVN